MGRNRGSRAQHRIRQRLPHVLILTLLDQPLRWPTSKSREEFLNYRTQYQLRLVAQ